MQWLRSTIEFGLALLLLGATVCSLPNVSYIINIICIIIVIFLFYINNRVNRGKCIERISLHEKIDKIDNIDVYVLDYEDMGSHNVIIVQGKENKIAIEKRVLQELTEKEKKAVLLHECGHCHTVSQEQIYVFQCCSLAMSAIGLHLLMYCNMSTLCIIGIIACLIVEYLKSYIEDAADKYAIKQGCGKEYLISAISKIENMNEGSTKIKISNHPKLKARIKKIKGYEC